MKNREYTFSAAIARNETESHFKRQRDSYYLNLVFENIKLAILRGYSNVSIDREMLDFNCPEAIILLKELGYKVSEHENWIDDTRTEETYSIKW
jgi:hypothetical protein